MIDWITAIFPCEHSEYICGGLISSYDAGGAFEWQSYKRLSVEGSHSSTVQVKSVDLQGQMLWVSGNPTKFLQGHNLFGTDDLLGLIYVFYDELACSLGLNPSEFSRKRVQRGIYELSRVDATAMIPLRSQADVAAFLRAASPTVRGKHQGASAYSGETIYIGQKSRRITTKMYNKFLEMQKHQLPKEIPYRNELIKYAENKLRVEVTIRSMELKDRGLHVASNWTNETASSLVAERLKDMKLPDKMTLTKATLKNLPGRLQMVYDVWEDGKDIRSLVSERTFYRYRAELLKHGIDISIPQPPKPQSNVVPMVRYIVAEYRGTGEIPDFAKGTELYANPSRRIA
jgi:II/X family phage/plasmid replication protein